MLISRIAGHFLRHLTCCFFMLSSALSLTSAHATLVSTLSLDDTVRSADAVVLGTILSHNTRWGDSSHRWMETDYILAVEDLIYASESGIPIKETITLTYWGGSIDGETQAISDIRLPSEGERLVVMLQPGWSKRSGFTPTVGFNQGMFVVATNPSTGLTSIRDGNGRKLGLSADGHLQLFNGNDESAAGAPKLSVVSLSAWLRANIPLIKKSLVKKIPVISADDVRLLKPFSKTPFVFASISTASSTTSMTQIPLTDQSPESGAGAPTVPDALDQSISIISPATSVTTAKNSDGIHYYSSNHQAHLPIVVNNFPPSFTAWTPEDQYQMSKWNYYASNVFHVYTTPTGTYSWRDGVFDLVGWPSDADLQRVYGYSWNCGTGCTVLGVTFLRYDGGGWIIEGDLALNPAASWTLDDEWVFNGGNANGFRQTMVHELGHMHGLEHNFNDLAIMNYMEPSAYRFYSLPFADDANGIRAEYPSNAVGLADLGVYLFYETGTCYDPNTQTFNNCISDVTLPSSVTSGGTLRLSNFHLENVGTTTISVPTIEWYLTTARNYNSSYYYLGQTTYSSLAPFTYFLPSAMQETFTVPANVPSGNYFISAFIRNDTGAGQSTFPFSNNFAFSRIPVNVSTITLSGTVHAGSATGAGLAGATVSIAGFSTTTSSAGTFSIAGISSGTYTLTISKTGYNTYTDPSYTITANKSGQVFFLTPYSTLSGTLHSGSATGAVLAGATVSIAGLSATTSSTGTFSITGIPSGTYSLTISKAGYNTYTDPAYTIAANKTGQVLFLTPYSTLSGTVRVGSATGSVLAGATVSIAGLTATTTSTGTFSITGIHSGTYILRISKTGYVPYVNEAYAITANRTGQVFFIVPYPTLSGTVRSGSATGAVIAGATVSIAGKTATTSSTGTFTVTGIPSGTYNVIIFKPGFATNTISGYTITAAKTGEIFVLTPYPTYSISGTIRSGSGVGPVLAAATVSCAGKTAPTSATGTFTLTGIPAGIYSLVVSKTGYSTYTLSPYSISGNLTSQDHYITPVFSLAGTVRSGSSTGAVVGSATVTIAGQTAITSATGTFTVTGIPSGTHTLSISKAGLGTYTNASYSITANKTAQVFILPTAAKLTLSFSPNPAVDNVFTATVSEVNGIGVTIDYFTFDGFDESGNFINTWMFTPADFPSYSHIFGDGSSRIPAFGTVTESVVNYPYSGSVVMSVYGRDDNNNDISVATTEYLNYSAAAPNSRTVPDAPTIPRVWKK